MIYQNFIIVGLEQDKVISMVWLDMVGEAWLGMVLYGKKSRAGNL